jgi:mannan endo-1,4-beta-mannosidase
VAALTALVAGPAAAQPAVDKYEAEAAVNNNTTIADLPSASGGKYVKMEGGSLTFSVTAPSDGFYTVWAFYSQTYDASKIQNFVVNGSLYGPPSGSIGFPQTGAIDGPPVFKRLKAIGKVRFVAGANTLAITNSWGWVDIDCIEVGPYVSEPFKIGGSLVTPNASQNARKVYGFLRDNFQKKIISGVMTDRAAQDDGKYTPHTLVSQPEVKHIKDASGKQPALLGLDFMHSSGFNSGEMWFKGYTGGVLGLAEAMFNAGGIPIFCWHWKDPLGRKESFYTDVGNKDNYTDFDPAKIFSDAECATVNPNSNEYRAVIADIDSVSGLLKTLADKNIAVLWRPLHEAAGGWFWWGRDKKPKPCNALWKLMFDRMVNHHRLDNLIWVWTCEESGDALEWYPGDEYVDIIGRDIYPNPDQRAKIHNSRVSNFEHLKELYGARKIIALSENGAIPHPDSLVADAAGWSWFMPWNQDFTTSVNTVSEWNSIMHHDYVITLDEMPGWDTYQPPTAPTLPATPAKAQPSVSVKVRRNSLELNIRGMTARSVELFDLRGARLAVLSNGNLGNGNHIFPTTGLARRMCFVRLTGVDKKVTVLPVRIY